MNKRISLFRSKTIATVAFPLVVVLVLYQALREACYDFYAAFMDRLDVEIPKVREFYRRVYELNVDSEPMEPVE